MYYYKDLTMDKLCKYIRNIYKGNGRKIRITVTNDIAKMLEAKLLKEKGFPQPDTIKGNLFYCEMPFNEDFGYSKIVKYNEGELLSDEKLDEEDFQNHSIMFFDYCPTLSLIQKWLREEKKISILPSINLRKDIGATNDKCKYTPEIFDLNLFKIINFEDYKNPEMNFDTPEEALSVGINKILELI